MSFKYVKKVGARDPTKASGLPAGIDFYPCVKGVIHAGEVSHKISTGIEPEFMPNGTYLRLAIRSGRAAKNKLALNAGIIDRDYTGDIVLIIDNKGTEDYTYSPDEAIAQGIFTYYCDPNTIKFESVSTHTAKTERGSNGFGSTDIISLDTNTTDNKDENKSTETEDFHEDYLNRLSCAK